MHAVDTMLLHKKVMVSVLSYHFFKYILSEISRCGDLIETLPEAETFDRIILLLLGPGLRPAES